MNNLLIVKYLNNLYKSDYKHNSDTEINTEIVNSNKIKWMKKYINENTNKFIFFEKHAGPYCKRLEKKVSLNKKKLKKINTLDMSNVYYTWIKHNNLTKEQHKQFNRAVLISVYKKGDKNNPSNYRYLYNFSNIIKLLDKIWSLEICRELIGKIDNTHFLSYFISTDFNNDIRYVATKFTDNLDNKIMLDFEKAFDNVSFYAIKQLLKDFLIRKLGTQKGTMYFERYFNIITNSNIYYEKIKIKRNKGIPTGLPSSNLIFTMLMDQIFYIVKKTNPHFIKFCKYSVYVDDIAIDITNKNDKNIKKYIEQLLSIFKYYQFKCNPSKCLISNNIRNNFINFKIIDKNIKYLGIYFTRNPKDYLNIIINEFNKKHDTKFNYIYQLIKYNPRKSKGFLRYKLFPFLNKVSTIKTYKN